MDQFFIVLQILGVLLLGAVSPGPSFVVVSRSSAAQSRRAGLLAALGMGVGGALFATLALLGVGALLHSHEKLFHMASVAGGVYLLYLAVRMLLPKRSGVSEGEGADGTEDAGNGARGRPFFKGLGVQISNPKTIVVYASVFAAILPTTVEPVLFVVLPPLVFCVEAGWYTVVAVFFSSDFMRAFYLRMRRWVDGAAGAVIGALALKTLTNAARGLL